MHRAVLHQNWVQITNPWVTVEVPPPWIDVAKYTKQNPWRSYLQSMTLCCAFVLVVSSVMDFDLQVFLIGGSEGLLSSSSSGRARLVYCDAMTEELWHGWYAFKTVADSKKNIWRHVQTILWHLSTHIYYSIIKNPNAWCSNWQMHPDPISRKHEFENNMLDKHSKYMAKQEYDIHDIMSGCWFQLNTYLSTRIIAPVIQ